MTVAASPQLEDGYIRIANELNDAIWRMPFSHRQHKVIFAIIRKTYGYGKKEDDMSASQIGEYCGLSRTHVTSTLNQLAEMNVIAKKPGVYGSVVGINKDYSKWVFPSAKSVHMSRKSTSTKAVQVSQNGTSTKSVQGVPNRASASTKSVQVDSTESVHTKENLPKDNLQKNPPSPPGGKTDSKAGKTKTAPPDGFVLAWNEYPKRDGANPKRDALNSWRARVREGVDEEIMIGATKAYAAAMSEKGKVGTEFVMQAKRFYGPSRPFEDYMAGSPQEGWWVSAGFKNPYEAENAGCTERTAYLWREGKRLEATA